MCFLLLTTLAYPLDYLCLLYQNLLALHKDVHILYIQCIKSPLYVVIIWGAASNQSTYKWLLYVCSCLVCKYSHLFLQNVMKFYPKTSILIKKKSTSSIAESTNMKATKSSDTWVHAFIVRFSTPDGCGGHMDQWSQCESFTPMSWVQIWRLTFFFSYSFFSSFIRSVLLMFLVSAFVLL